MQIKFKQTFFILVFALLYFYFFSFQLILEKWVFLVAPIVLAFFIYYLGHLDKFLMLIVFFTPKGGRGNKKRGGENNLIKIQYIQCVYTVYILNTIISSHFREKMVILILSETLLK